MPQSTIYLLVFLIPAIGLLSGFSIALTLPILFLVILFILWDNITIHLKYETVKNNLLANWKLELLFALWCLIANFYSPNYPDSVINYLQIFIVAIMGFVINNNIDKLPIDLTKTKLYFLIGIATAIILFFIEYFSHGIITKTFRTSFQPKSSVHFFLFLLDRGCSLLSVLSWVVIIIFIQYRKYLLASVYYILIFYLLYISDSLASFLAFAVGGLVFLISRISVNKLLHSIVLKSFIVAIIAGSVLMPIISYKLQPYDVSDQYSKYLPDSAKHRIFIWHFVAEKIIEKPTFGYGFTSSRNFKINENDIVEYNQWTWSPFPLHPHNNILQILFEIGIIGFILFLSLIYKYIQQINNITFTTPKDQYTNSNADILNYKSVSYACFINYYIIGMISFNIWQIWWVCTAFGVVTLFKLFTRRS